MFNSSVSLVAGCEGYADLSPENQNVSETQMDYGTEIDVVLEKTSTKNGIKKDIDDGVKIGERVYLDLPIHPQDDYNLSSII